MKKLTTLFMAMICLASTASASTKSCADINLFDLNDNLDSIRIKDQGDMNTCYAHASSTSFNLEQTNPKDFIHPYWIAFIHKNRRIQWMPQDLDFSFLTWAHKDIEKNGVCDISFINDKLSTLKAGVDITDDKLFYLYKEFFDVKKDKYTWQKNIKNTFNQLKKNSEDYKWTSSNVSILLNKIKGSTEGLKLFPFLKTHVFNGCENHINKSVPILNSYGMAMESNEDLLETIQSKLLGNKILSIGHCPDVTYDPGFSSKKSIGTMPRLFKSFSRQCGAHYANVAGMRKKTNGCEVLVRNSYGKGFWVDKSITCLCENKESGKRSDCSKNTFKIEESKVLGCWIDSERLLDSTYELNAY